jgi:hypothetical protein
MGYQSTGMDTRAEFAENERSRVVAREKAETLVSHASCAC